MARDIDRGAATPFKERAKLPQDDQQKQHVLHNGEIIWLNQGKSSTVAFPFVSCLFNNEKLDQVL